MVRIIQKGDFSRLERFLNKVLRKDYLNVLEKYGQIGVRLLAANTPKDTGETAASWNYAIAKDDKQVSLMWTNSNINKGVPIAIILQYGHATRNGGYVTGLDYINPAMRPVFESLADEVWKEVTE